MSSAVANVRGSLFVQAGLTLVFALFLPGSSGPWTAASIVVAVAAVGLGAALKPTPQMRLAVLAFEGVVVTYGVASLALQHVLVPGTIVGGFLLARLAQTPAAEFVGVPAPVPGTAGEPGVTAAGPMAWPPAPAAPGAAAPWPAAGVVAWPPAAAPAPAPPGPVPPPPPVLPVAPAGAPAFPPATPASPVATAPLPIPAPSTAPVVPVQSTPPVPEQQPAVPAPMSPLEAVAARELLAPPAPELPTSAVPCVTILPG